MQIVLFDKCRASTSHPGLFGYHSNLFHGTLYRNPDVAGETILVRNTFVEPAIFLPSSYSCVGPNICIREDLSGHLGRVLGLESVPIAREHTFCLPYALGERAPERLREIEPYMDEAMDGLDDRLFRDSSVPSAKYHLYRIRSYMDLPPTPRRRLAGKQIFNDWDEEGEVIVDEAMMDRIGMCKNEFGKQVSARVFGLLSEYLVEPWFRSWTLEA